MTMFDTKRKWLQAGSLALIAATIASCSKEAGTSDGLSAADNGAIIPGSYIVVFKEEAIVFPAGKNALPYAGQQAVMEDAALEILATYDMKATQIENVYVSAVKGISITADEETVEMLSRDERIRLIEPDRLITLGRPPGKGGDGGGGGTAPQEVPYGITRVGGSGSGVGKTAWIIDTGVDLDHPDLQVDVARSRTFVSTGKDSKNADDGNGHGSHVAGTIAALNNEIGVVGVAAGAQVVAVKVLNAQGSGSYSAIIAGVDYVAANGQSGDVANMSLGGPGSQALDDAIVNAASQGIAFAVAAGNSTDDAGNYSPARVNAPNVYTISAIDSQDLFAYFSNYGNPPVDYSAPGVAVLSCWKGGGYNTISGTSMAAPHAAGVLLMTGLNPGADGVAGNDPDGNPDPIIHR